MPVCLFGKVENFGIGDAVKVKKNSLNDNVYLNKYLSDRSKKYLNLTSSDYYLVNSRYLSHSDSIVDISEESGIYPFDCYNENLPFETSIVLKDKKVAKKWNKIIKSNEKTRIRYKNGDVSDIQRNQCPNVKITYEYVDKDSPYYKVCLAKQIDGAREKDLRSFPLSIEVIGGKIKEGSGVTETAWQAEDRLIAEHGYLTDEDREYLNETYDYAWKFDDSETVDEEYGFGMGCRSVADHNKVNLGLSEEEVVDCTLATYLSKEQVRFESYEDYMHSVILPQVLDNYDKHNNIVRTDIKIIK